MKQNKKNDIKRSVRTLWKIVFVGIIAVIILFGGAYIGIFGKLPSLRQLENPEADLATEIYADDGTTLMGKYYLENRISVDYKDISPNVINALISTEDERFYSHSGVDFKATMRALWSLGRDGGGSTITQQLAKNMLGQGRGNPLKRGIDKIKEWIVAIKLERNFTKQEIIALYLNRVSWLNIYGIRNAALTYFQKEPKELDLEESAMLVGMLKGPAAYNPIRRPDAAIKRRNIVIDQMVRNGMLSSNVANTAKESPLDINYKAIDETVGIAPYFRMVLKKQLQNWCSTHKNPETGENYDLYRDGLKIYTTINATMQQDAEDAVAKHMAAMQKQWNSVYGKRNLWKGQEDILKRAKQASDRYRFMKEQGYSIADIDSSFNTPRKMKIFAWNKERSVDTTMTPMDSIKYLKQFMQTGFLSMDPSTGEIKAWVGGIDFQWFKFDHVTTPRQVGSTFKPLLYTLAITDAGLTPESMVGGNTITVGGKTFSGGGGTLAYCLARSINVAAMDLIQRIGPRRTAEFAHEAGVTSNIPLVPSIALGAADIKLIDMLQAYTMFPNHGYNVQPIMINKIEDKNGNVLQVFQAKTTQLISEVDAYTMYKMMKGVVDYGTGASLRSIYGIKSDMGGKTGTTNDNTDGWFIGYTPQLLSGAWVGFDDPFLKLTGTGNRMALPEFAYYMLKVYQNRSLGYDVNATFQQPEQMSNNPFFADQNFANIVNDGKGFEPNETDNNVDEDNTINDYKEFQPASTDNPKQGQEEGNKLHNTSKKDSAQSRNNKQNKPNPPKALKPQNPKNDY